MKTLIKKEMKQVERFKINLAGVQLTSLNERKTQMIGL